METEYKNYFSAEVLNNNVVINKLKKVLNSMKTSENLVVSKDDYKGYIYEDTENKAHYLIYENQDITTIYRTERTYQKPFDGFLKGDIDSLKYYADKIISFYNSKNVEEKYNNKIEKILNDYPEKLRSHVRGTLIDMLKIPQQSVTSNPYEFKLLLNFLEKNEFATEFNKDFLYQNKKLYEKVQERVSEFGIVLQATKEALKNKNINEKNKFEYNDLDNHIWKNSQYIISTDQNFSWVIDIEDKNNLTIYTALLPHNGNGSKAKSTTGLLKKIKSGEELDFLDYIGLKVENGKVVYANNAFMYSLDFNIMLNKKVLEEEGMLNIEYGDIDMKSFDYQFAYANTQYGTGKVEFLIHALFVLGNGYNYDRESGKIYSDVKYIPGLLENFKYKETKEDKKPIKSLVYLAPQKLEYLDDQWLENLRLIVEKIKNDKPDLSKTHTSYLNGDKNPKEVLKDLDKVISYNEKIRKNTPKI